MFRALIRDGKRISSLSGNTKDLKERSKGKQLICPYCSENMQFVNSTLKRPHFRHLIAECTYIYHDSESEEHERGKELIFQQLKVLYPESCVKYEERVKETNQIADVMLTHPDGSRWAFEFQCFILTDVEWKARHKLYKKAGLTDFWVFGDIAVHSYSENESINLSGKKYHKLKAMERAVFDSGSPLYYLNTESKKLCIIDDGYYSSDTIFEALESEDDFTEAYIRDKQWYSPSREKIAEDRRLELERIEEALRLDKEAKQDVYQAWEKKQKIRETDRDQHLSALIIQRDNFMEDFTPKEKELFLSLIEKHGFNRNTFPGLLQVEVEHFELIKTPVQLWQLWIYDKNIAGRVNKSSKTPYINADYIIDGFKDRKRDGYFRVAYNSSSESNYTFALYDYLKLLCHVGVLEKMGFYGAKKYIVLVNKIPTYEERGLNIQQKMVLEHDYSQHNYAQCDYAENNYFKNNDSINVLQKDIKKLQEEAYGITSKAEGKSSNPSSITPEMEEYKRNLVQQRVAQAKQDAAQYGYAKPEIDNSDLKAEIGRREHFEWRKKYVENERLAKEKQEVDKIVAKAKQEIAATCAQEELIIRRDGDEMFQLSKRNGLFEGLTEKEKEFFTKLCKKHGFTEDSYPGIFDVEVEHSDMIQTPNRVWQLWLYDRCIYKKNESQLLYITAIYDRSVKRIYDFLTLKDKGIFKTSANPDYRFAFYEYIRMLTHWGILRMVEIRRYEILISEIPSRNAETI